MKKTFPVLPQEGYNFIVSQHLRYCEAEEVKQLMEQGSGFVDACTKVGMEWLQSQEAYAVEDLARDGYAQCSIEFSCFVHYLVDAGVISIEGELYKRASDLQGF
jgi:hypothetical protein